MIRSFLNAFLPDDEYKRLRVLYFMAEAAFLMGGFLIVGSALNNYWLQWNFNTNTVTFILLMIPMVMGAYAFIRYIFSGIEYTEVSNKKDYNKERRAVVKRSLLFGVMFFIIHFIFKGIPANYDEGIDLVVLPIMVIIFYFLFDLFSLKRSIKKNKELDD